MLFIQIPFFSRQNSTHKCIEFNLFYAVGLQPRLQYFATHTYRFVFYTFIFVSFCSSLCDKIKSKSIL